jgi:hypothetical protein
LATWAVVNPHDEQRKVFFSEEKKQKLRTRSNKSFLVLFFKKELLAS